MAHGTPDWGQTAGTATIFQLEDLAELAVRLGSIDRFHRSGDVLFMDDFEAGLAKWTSTLAGAGAAADLTMARARSGLFAARLVGGSDAGRSALIYRPEPFAALSRFGWEISVSVPVDVESLGLSLLVYDGTNLTQFRLRWIENTEILSYQDSGGFYQTLATGRDLDNQGGTFHTLKLVADAVNAQYVRVILDDQVYTPATLPAVVSANATVAHLRAEVRVDSDSGDNDELDVDDAILTQNEPA